MVVPQVNKTTNGSVDVLSWLYAMYALPTRGNYELWAPLLHSLVRGLFRRQQYRELIAGKWCYLIFSRGVVLFGLLILHRPVTHRAGVCSGWAARPGVLRI